MYKLQAGNSPTHTKVRESVAYQVESGRRGWEWETVCVSYYNTKFIYYIMQGFRVSQLIRQRIEKVYVDQVKMRDYH